MTSKLDLKEPPVWPAIELLDAGNIAQFLGLEGSNAISFSEAFNVGNGARISFQPRSGGSVSVGEVRDGGGALSIRIAPIGIDESKWFSIEVAVDAGAASSSSQLIAMIDLKSTRSLRATSVLRLHLGSGDFRDLGSSQVVIDHKRSRYSFPVVSAFAHQNGIRRIVDSATFIIFLEARDVELDIYSICLYGVDMVSADSSVLPDNNQLRSGSDAEVGLSLFSLSARPSPRRKALWSNQVLYENLLLDIDSDSGEYALLESDNSSVIIDLTHSSTSRWRTLEARLDSVLSSDKNILAIELSLVAPGASQASPISLWLRFYEAGGTSWVDSEAFGKIESGDHEVGKRFSVDLSRKIPEGFNLRSVGVMILFPRECRAIELFEFEVSLLS